jgi:hypothetical protein
VIDEEGMESMLTRERRRKEKWRGPGREVSRRREIGGRVSKREKKEALEGKREKCGVTEEREREEKWELKVKVRIDGRSKLGKDCQM